MDKMKDNLFGLGVFLVVVVLGGAGYSLVWSPKADPEIHWRMVV